MSRRLLILAAALLYGLGVFIVRRLQRLRAARRGLVLARLQVFDHRGLLDELEALYRAGRPEAGGSTAPFEVELPRLGEPVPWAGPADFGPGDRGLERLPPPVREAARVLRAGDLVGVSAHTEPGQPAEVDQAFAALGIHAFLARLYGGDLEGAVEVLGRLPEWTNGRIAERMVEVYRVQVAVLRAEVADGGQRARHARTARRHLKVAAATHPYAEPAVRAFFAQVELCFFTNPLNLELVEVRVARHLKRGLSEHPTAPALYFVLGHLLARRGRVSDAIDNLARAAYFSRGRAFYRDLLLGDPMVARMRPGLIVQLKSDAARQGEEAVGAG